VSRLAEQRLLVLRFLGSLLSGQWQQARAGGLRWPEEVTPDQLKRLQAVMMDRNMSGRAPAGLTSIVITIGDLAETADGKATRTRIVQTTPGKGTQMSTLSGRYSTASGGGAPRRWHQFSMKATSRNETSGKETVVFERQEAFFPKELTVSAAVPD